MNSANLYMGKFINMVWYLKRWDFYNMGVSSYYENRNSCFRNYGDLSFMNIAEIRDDLEKKKITRYILEALPEWFGLSDSREEYIRDSEGKLFFCAYSNEEPVGFLYLKETGKDTVELAVMGVLKEYHRKGIGKALFECAKKVICEKGYSFIQVKTVQMGRYEEYDNTNRFYLSLGFKELEVFPTLWDEWNPCQIYVMAI